MSKQNTICKVMGISQASYYRWKKERPVIALLEKYFTDEELIEFIETEHIARMEGMVLPSKMVELEERIQVLEEISKKEKEG